MNDGILAAVDGAASRAVNLLAELVRIRTVNPYSGEGGESTERQGQERLKQALDALGGQSVLFDCPADIYERMGVHGPRGRQFEGRPNLVSEFRFGGGGPCVILNGHMDTVGVADMEFDPFGAEVRDGRMLGRGACDCKGGLAAGWLALSALREAGALSGGRVLFESVIDEECSGSGAGTLACLDRGYAADAAIVLDGPGDRLVTGCMGILTGEITVRGRGGHAGSRDVVSAIDKGIVVKRALDGVKQEREQISSGTTLNVGVFQAGVSPTVVPATARLAFNLQYELAERRGAGRAGLEPGGACAKDQVARALAGACQADDWLRGHPPRLEWVKDLRPFRTDTDADLVRAVRQAHREATGAPIGTGTLPAWNDAAWLATLGRMPAVAYGVVREGEAHSTHECVWIEDVVRVARTVALAVRALLRG